MVTPGGQAFRCLGKVCPSLKISFSAKLLFLVFNKVKRHSLRVSRLTRRCNGSVYPRHVGGNCCPGTVPRCHTEFSLVSDLQQFWQLDSPVVPLNIQHRSFIPTNSWQSGACVNKEVSTCGRQCYFNVFRSITHIHTHALSYFYPFTLTNFDQDCGIPAPLAVCKNCLASGIIEHVLS